MTVVMRGGIAAATRATRVAGMIKSRSSLLEKEGDKRNIEDSRRSSGRDRDASWSRLLLTMLDALLSVFAVLILRLRIEFWDMGHWRGVICVISS